MDVSVAGTRVKETSGSAHIVRAKQLERFEYDDPHQVLLGVPGVYVRGEDGYGLRPNIGMRGALSDRSKKITLMEDGVLLGPAPYSAPAAYYFPLITRMTAVRVVKGPSTIVYGPHTVAGAVDMTTAPVPTGPKTMVDVALGNYLYRKVHVRQSFGDETRGVLVEGVHIGTTGFKELDGGGDTGFSRYEMMAKGRWSLGTLDTLFHDIELKAGYSGEVSNETYLGLTDADFRKTPYRRYAASALDRMEWNRMQFALTHRVTNGSDLTLETTAYRHDLHRRWNKVNGMRGASLSDVLHNPTTPKNALYYSVLTGQVPASTNDEMILIGPNDRTYVSQGIQTTLKWKPKTGPISHRIELGARVHYDSIKRVHTQDEYQLENGGLVQNGSPTEMTADNLGETTALAAHIIDAATWGRLTVTAGVRVESIHGVLHDELAGRSEGMIQQVLLPGGGVFLALPFDLGVFAGAYQGFSPIPPGQSNVVRPEKSINYEAGIRYSPKKFRVEVIGFYNDYTNLSNVCTVSTGCVQENVDQQFDGGNARVYGLEVYAESEWKIRKDITLPGRLAYTYTDARFLTAFQSSDPIFGNVEENDFIPYVPEHQLSISAGVEVAKWALNAGFTYVSPMREEAEQGEFEPEDTTDAQYVLDASASFRPWSWLTLYLNGRNLANQAYIVSRRPFGARPGAPLSVQGGAKVEF
ncbi:MAG: TonB-dependent receptor [Polyangiaceae bacterium]|nr:TonB-dependent receptor [Polyangiaceae bacterium]